MANPGDRECIDVSKNDYKASDTSKILLSNFDSLCSNISIIKDFEKIIADKKDKDQSSDSSPANEAQKAFRAHLLDRYFGLGTHLYSSAPFFCDLKLRYEDFHVLELSSASSKPSPVHLTSLTVEDDDEKWAPPKTSLSDLQWSSSASLIASISDFATNKELPEIDLEIPELSKEQRTSLHQFIRQEHSNLESSTQTKDGKNFLKLGKKRRKDKDGNQVRSDRRWPPGKEDYYKFVLYKENVDTESAIRAIGGNIDSKRFGYCGTKDKRGITTQEVTGYRIRPTEIARNCANFNRKSNGFSRIHVGHFELVKEKLFLGHHSGNAFRIFLKNVREFGGEVSDGSKKERREKFAKDLNQKLKKLSQNGFINYFGTQRFGSISMDNHWIGLSILKKDYEKAILGILRPRNEQSNKNRQYNEAMKHYSETRNAAEAFKLLDPRSKGGLEGRLLQALTKNGNNYHNSLVSGMSRNMRMIYVHAFQSYVWNLVASFRAEHLNGKVLVGDLVNGNQKVKRNGEKSKNDKEETGNRVGDLDLDIEFPWLPKDIELFYGLEIVQSKDDKNDKDGSGDLKDKSSIIFVTEENIDDYSIDDIYLPMISHDTKIPDNIVGSFLMATLEGFGLELEHFRSLAKDWLMDGSYRKFIGRLVDFTGIPFLYDAKNPPEIVSDLQLIKQSNKDSVADKDPETDQKRSLSELSDEEKEIGMIVTFSLDIGHYATMALRELSKLGTLSIESRQFHPTESVKNILQNVKISQLFHQYFHEDWSEMEKKAFVEWIIEKVKEVESKDKLMDKSFDEFCQFLEDSLKNSVIEDEKFEPSETKKTKIDFGDS